MNRQELVKVLEKEGISPDYCSLYGDLISDRIVVYENYAQWEVFYLDERGGRRMLRVCRSEEDACDCIHNYLARVLLVNENVRFSQQPKLLPETMVRIKEVGVLETSLHVWIDSLIKQGEFSRHDVSNLVFELEKSERSGDFKIHLWGSNHIGTTNGNVSFSVDYIPFYDWISIGGEHEKTDFDTDFSQAISRLREEDDLYRNFFDGKSLYVGFRDRIHVV